MTFTDVPTIDQAKLEAFVGQAAVDMGAAISGLLLHLGYRLGRDKAMAGAGSFTSATPAAGTGPITSARRAGRTGTAEDCVREWLGTQPAGGYVRYDPTDTTYELPAEQ